MKGSACFLLLVGSLNLFAADFRPFAGPKPIVVLIQTDPWAMVIGADTPRVAVYENGTVIFLKKSGRRASYHRKDLSATELSDFKQRLTPTARLKDLKPAYNLPPYVTDQPEALFYLRDAASELTTRVYGLKAGGTTRAGYTVRPGDEKPDAVPGELLELHEFLCAVNYPNSQQWTPKYVDVMVWPYEYAPDASIQWPKDWPGLDSKRSFKRGDSYSIFLDGDVLPALQKFLRTRKEKGAVEIGGKKWAVSWRFVFPSEPVWRKALRGTPEK